ncbi:MAG: hypothetical protein K2X86_07205 [Cytophagaceae bacterium]|nr:hypothetical protein [Cytophagaceae bacterium]
MPVGNYTDIRFNIGVPRNINHSDPSLAPPPLDLGKGGMFWEWNSGYIFFLAEGKCEELKGNIFHFAIGGDARIMPFSFGNIFDIEPIIKIQAGKTTRIKLVLDFNKIVMNGDGSIYNIKSSGAFIVHGGYNADQLRNNILQSIQFVSSEVLE